MNKRGAAASLASAARAPPQAQSIVLGVGLGVLANGPALLASGLVMSSRSRRPHDAAITEYNSRCR